MKISGYTIKSRIGSGGQAMVYHAIQESLQRPVALKVLSPLHSDSPEFTARFLNEGRILANLGHSNVITIHDIGVENSLHYLSMELVEGGDLKQRMRDGIEPETVLKYVRSIADCLATAHDKKIVHRDIKPANVLFRRDGTLLLTDFGIAKQLDDESDLTVTGTTVGSPHYLSPEQARGKAIDGRADIYSLGIMTYEMLVRQKPFVGESNIDTIFKHINEPIPRLPEHLSEYQELIDRMVAKLPEDRFGTARDVVTFIDQIKVTSNELHTGLRETGSPEKSSTVNHDAATAVNLDTVETEINIDTVETEVDLKAAETQINLDTVETAVDRSAAQTEVNLKAVTGRPANRRLFMPAIAAVAVAGVVLGWLLLGRSPPPPPDTTSMASKPAARESAAAPPDTSTATAEISPDDGQSEDRSVDAAASAGAATVAATPPSLVPDDGREARVASLLSSANLALEEFRLTTPEGNNALEYFEEVLSIDPTNPVAADGPTQIAKRYGVLAGSEIKRGNHEKARDFIDRGLLLDAQSAELLALRNELETSLAERDTSGDNSPASADSTSSAGNGGRSEIKGESPKELYERVKGWFK